MMRNGFVIFPRVGQTSPTAGNGARLLLLITLLLAAGCSSQQGGSGGGGFHVKNLAKSDIDLVADAHRRAGEAIIARLLVKFYKRNPRELRKTPSMTLVRREAQFASREYDPASMVALEGKRGIDLIRLAFAEGFSGDRVFALMLGTRDMLDESYGGKQEFFFLDELDRQKLFNSARNLEVVAWLLRTRLDDQGKPLILSNSRDSEQLNLSFERLYGRLIGIQDMMAIIISGDTQRAINTVAHSVVSMTLIPL